MVKKLSFEDWKKKYISVSNEVIPGLEEYHNIDANILLDEMCQELYNKYLKEEDNMNT